MTTTWSFDGVDLETIGHITLNDDYIDVPDKRGDNPVISNRHGSVFVKKYYGERSVQIGMAVKRYSAVDLELAIDSIKKLFSSRYEKVLSNTRADGSVRTIMASVEGKIQTKRESYNFARVVVNFKCSKPFFRGSSLILDNTAVIDSSPKSMTVDNTGTVEECDPVVILTGPLLNTVVTNDENGVSLTYDGSIPYPRVVTVQTIDNEMRATDDLGTNVIANISHSGSETHMVIERDTNNITITDDLHTTGSVKITFYPPFL